VRRLIAAICILTGIVSGCQNSATAPASKPSGDLATLERSGGFAPMEITFTLFEDGRFGLIRIGGPASFSTSGTLTPRQFQQFREQLAATAKLESEYDNPRAADDHKFKLSYAGRTIRWSQAYNPLPPQLSELSSLLDALLTSAAPAR
jgi:hypothetical protein